MGTVKKFIIPVAIAAASGLFAAITAVVHKKNTLNMEEMNMPDFKKVNEEIAKGVTGSFQKIEDGVADGYKKIESTVVGTYKQVEDAFVSRFLTREGETVEEAKARLAAEQTAREEQAKADAEKRAAEQKARIEAAKNAGKH